MGNMKEDITIEDLDKALGDLGTIRKAYKKEGIKMFEDWNFPRSFNVGFLSHTAITVLSVVEPKYGCVTVLFKYQSGFTVDSRIEDIDTFIELFGECLL